MPLKWLPIPQRFPPPPRRRKLLYEASQSFLLAFLPSFLFSGKLLPEHYESDNQHFGGSGEAEGGKPVELTPVSPRQNGVLLLKVKEFDCCVCLDPQKSLPPVSHTLMRRRSKRKCLEQKPSGDPMRLYRASPPPPRNPVSSTESLQKLLLLLVL